MAIGSYYGTIGDRFIVTTSTNNKIKIIVLDQKASRHTIDNAISKSGSMLEILICKERAAKYHRYAVCVRGNMSYVDGLSGKVTKIVKCK